MIKTLSLDEAISQVFGIDNVPKFTDDKPMKQARAWLESQNIAHVYERGQMINGVVVYSIGSSSPQFAIADGEQSFKGAQVYGILAPKQKSKSQQRREDAMKVANDDVESAPAISSDPDAQADEEITVSKPTKRKSGRRK